MPLHDRIMPGTPEKSDPLQAFDLKAKSAWENCEADKK